MVAGQWLADRLAKFGIPRPQAVPFGLDRSLFSPDHRDEALRRQWLQKCGVGPEGKLLITLSRLHPEKRLNTLFRAVATLNREQPVGLAVFGDGPLRGWVEQAAARAPTVHLAGKRRP